MKKGRYVYYHCTGYRGKRPEPYTREETLEDRYAGRLRKLVIPAEIITWLEQELVTSDAREQSEARPGIAALRIRAEPAGHATRHPL